MKTMFKYAAAATLAGALALAAATPSEARNGRNAAIIGGFAAGALVGAAVANSYYGPGYYGPGYYDDYAYAPDYAYEPGPVYVAPAPTYVAPAPIYRSGRCWVATDRDRGYGYYGPC
jgi:PXPV repeat (3 copies)